MALHISHFNFLKFALHDLAVHVVSLDHLQLFGRQLLDLIDSPLVISLFSTSSNR